jgi:GTPase
MYLIQLLYINIYYLYIRMDYRLQPENDNGNCEYKRYLVNLNEYRLEKLITQMKWRLVEGNNEAIYYLGVNDNGTLYNWTKKEQQETMKNFRILLNKNNAIITDFNKINSYFKIKIKKLDYPNNYLF